MSVEFKWSKLGIKSLSTEINNSKWSTDVPFLSKHVSQIGPLELATVVLDFTVTLPGKYIFHLIII